MLNRVSNLIKDQNASFAIVSDDINISNSQTMMEVYGKYEVEEVKTVLLEMGAKLITINTTKGILSDIANGKKPADYIINLGSGIADAFRYGQTPLLLELAEVPYSGPTPYSILLCRDKHRTKAVLRDLGGVRAPLSKLVNNGKNIEIDDISNDLLPAIVKPNNLGCSVGISGKIVRTLQDLNNEFNFIKDSGADEVIIEQFISGLEFTVLVCGNDNEFQYYLLGFVRSDGDYLPSNNIRSYQDMISRPEDVTWKPLEKLISSAKILETQKIVRKAWNCLGCRDMVRFDCRLDDKGQIWIIEANAQPDFSRNATYVPLLNEKFFNDELGLSRAYVTAFLKRVDALNYN